MDLVRIRLGGIGILGLTVLLGACSSDSGGGDSDSYYHRFEPADRLDDNNVSVMPEDATVKVTDTGRGGYQAGDKVVQYLGGVPNEDLDLPEAPKSGFRLVLPRIILEPYQEFSFDMCMPMPALENNYIYTQELRTGPGLHHGNMLALPRDEAHPRPYPNCNKEDTGNGLGQLFKAVALGAWDDFVAPEVLFANSTQTTDVDRYSSPDGYAIKIGEVRDIVMNTHLLNPTDEEIVLNTVYDFYTMPADLVEHTSAPFVWTWMDFNIPAQSQKTLGADCQFFGGDIPDAEITSVMPHMHEWGVGYDVTLHREDGSQDRIYDKRDVNMWESDIESYNPPKSAAGVNNVNYECHFDNNLDHDMGFGIGENEMCFLFGFVSPPEAATVGVILTEGTPCFSYNAGRPDLIPRKSLIQQVMELPTEQRDKVMDMLNQFLDRNNSDIEL